MSEGLGIADRIPRLEQVLRARDFQRVFEPFLGRILPAVVLFDRRGARHAGVWIADEPAAAWEQIPPEALAQVGAREPVVVATRRCLVRAVYAGAERIGTAVYVVGESEAAADGGADSPMDSVRLAQAVDGVLSQLLQSGFAAWITSELHLAASEDSYQAIEEQNAELRRAIAHLREVDELKANFLATISHELRTPLTSVIGFSEMLLDGVAGDLTDAQREYVQTILDRGEELLRLITQLLELSRMEVGSMRLELAPTDLGPLVERAVETLRPEAVRAGVEVRSEIEPGAVPRVLVDAPKIGQVLLNLLGNAIKFTPSGGQVVVRAVTAPIHRPFEEEDLFGEEAHDAVRVSVEDTGEGIEADKLERIFDRFYQVDSSPTRRHGGAGLGLAIVKSIVEAHGGEVWAESTRGVGTTIHVTLPRAQAGASGAS
ncbi:MAG: sensor histidine kinase [Deltaproteobacteria bacterium]|nr:MAG: sensor histidine kinase [Deltaproteobacteria bacterium]